MKKVVMDMPESGEIFGPSENKKGSWCPFKAIFCQEGYCGECHIYLTLHGKNNNGTSRNGFESKVAK